MTKIQAWKSASGKRNLKDLFHGEPAISPIRCEMLLLLASVEISMKTIKAWTDDQRRHAANWASRVYLRESDNLIELLAKPEFFPEKCQHGYHVYDHYEEDYPACPNCGYERGHRFQSAFDD